MRGAGIGVRLGTEGVIPVSDPPHASSGPDTAVDENRLEELIIEAQTALPVELPALANRCASSLGLDTALIYLVDLQQRLLVPLDETLDPLPVERSSAGRAYRTVSPRVTETDDGLVLWMPLVDGAERLGVLAVRTASLDEVRVRRSQMLAHLFAMLITSKRAYSDWLAARTRTATMGLPAEMLRAFLPPRTIGSRRCISTAVLEPAYDIAGDAFDHSVVKNVLHTMILDAMGHDLTAGLTTSVAMAAARNARRGGGAVADVVGTVDQALAEWLPEHFCTGVLCRLDAVTGVLRWVNCGHPPPLLIRAEEVLTGALDSPPPVSYTHLYKRQRDDPGTGRQRPALHRRSRGGSRRGRYGVRPRPVHRLHHPLLRRRTAPGRGAAAAHPRHPRLPAQPTAGRPDHPALRMAPAALRWYRNAPG